MRIIKSVAHVPVGLVLRNAFRQLCKHIRQKSIAIQDHNIIWLGFVHFSKNILFSWNNDFMQTSCRIYVSCVFIITKFHCNYLYTLYT